jgi:hypothetical protein
MLALWVFLLLIEAAAARVGLAVLLALAIIVVALAALVARIAEVMMTTMTLAKAVVVMMRRFLQ